MKQPPKPLRFAVRCPRNGLVAWQLRCLTRLSESNAGEIVLTFADEGRFSSPRESIIWRTHRAVVRTRARSLRRPEHGSPQGVRRVSSRAAPDGSLADRDAGLLREFRIDVLLDFGTVPLTGFDGEACTHGFWSFLPDAETLPGFRETRAGEPVTATALIRRTKPGGEVEVLREGTYRTDHSLVRTVDSVRLATSEWPAQIAAEIVRDGVLRTRPALASSATTEGRPSGRDVLVFLARAIRRNVRGVKVLVKVPHWNVGVVERPIQDFLRPGVVPPIRWLPELPRGRYLADPFAAPSDNGIVLLAEEYDHRTRHGRISVVAEAPGGRFTAPKPVLELDVHASYPYVFEHDGRFFCVPETSEARRVDLYRSLDFPGEWTKEATLIEGVAAVDPTVFRHDGRWWLFFTDRDRGGWAELHVWHAGDLLGPWKPHARNPVKIDVRSSRPAGTPFVHEGVLYRPAQDNSRGYGGAVVLNRVDRLTPEEFHETPVTTIPPQPDGPYPEGLHTICAVGDFTLIDGKRSRFAWSGVRSRVRLGRTRSGMRRAPQT